MNLDGISLKAHDRKLAQRMVAHLEEKGPVLSNVQLRTHLKCDKEKYFEIRNRLRDYGIVEGVQGGQGGRTRLLREHDDESTEAQPDRGNEAAIYERIGATLREEWAPSKGFQLVAVAQTSDYGKRAGGQWEHPDFVVGGFSVQPFVYGNQIDLYSFEVKRYSASVQDLYEAVYHRRFVNYAYLLLSEPGDDCDWDLLEALARETHIGIIEAENPGDSDKWNERVVPGRNQPPSDLMNAFIAARVPKDFGAAWRDWLKRSPTAEKPF